jgi:hypothetical protein
MSRKSILAIAAVAALGLSALVATDAFARGGGGGGGGHGGGGHGGFGGFSRSAHAPAARSVGRTFSATRTSHTTRTARTTRTSHTTRVTHVDRRELHRPTRIAHDHWREWCRTHHHFRCAGYGFDGGVYTDASPTIDPPVVSDAAPQTVAATPVAAVCTNDCDYFLNNEPGCYMAKRAFSTPQGEELRCVKICDQPETTK